MASVLVARSSLECHLYMSLHPCTCGDSTPLRSHRLASGAHGLIAIYEGVCPKCASSRKLELALADEIVPLTAFGGAAPSSIIDAGQFLAVSIAAASEPATVASLTRAIAALEEVVKLIPEGADRVPADSLHSPDGRALYDREPGRFRRSRLEAVLGVYRDALSKLTAD